jgi:hypothetical protein
MYSLHLEFELVFYENETPVIYLELQWKNKHQQRRFQAANVTGRVATY